MTELSEEFYIKDGRAWFPGVGPVSQDPELGILFAVGDEEEIYNRGLTKVCLVIEEPYRGFFYQRRGFHEVCVERCTVVNEDFCIKLLSLKLDIKIEKLPSWVELTETADMCTL